jgi:transcriptional regulator with XRE-family HTH domain
VEPDRAAVAEPGSPGPDEGRDEPEFREEVVRLGRLLRAARGDRFSLEALAKEAGVSAGLLSQIERGIGNPSFQTLARVARALGLRMTDLFAQRAPQDHVPDGVVRAENRRTMVWPREHLIWEVLTPPGTSPFTVLQAEVPPGYRGSVYYRPSYYEGWLFRLVLSGCMTVCIDDTTVVLHEGDALSCHSSRLHWASNESDEPAIMIAVMSPGAM